MTEQTRSYEEYCDTLRTLRQRHDQLQFQMGSWAMDALDQFGVTCQQLADDIVTSYKTLNEWVNITRFFHTDELSPELVQRIAYMHEERVQHGALTYSHFRQARRVALQTKNVGRVEQVRLALDYLDNVLDTGEKLSVTEARTAALCQGEDFQTMSIRYDSRDDTLSVSALDIARNVETHVRRIRRSGKRVRVVVYEVAI
jgi:hypothetical protein